MDIFPLSEFQTIKLADFFFDVAKGALLAAFGFTFAAPYEFIPKFSLFTAGVLTAMIFLYSGLWLVKGIKR